MLARLARAYMRLGHSEKAIARADEALAIAEPHRLESIVAEAFVNKGSALPQVGRWREGIALLQAAIELAARAGNLALELRARNNFGSTLSTEDAQRAHQVFVEAHELALRLGVAQMSLWLRGTLAYDAYYLGSWDDAIRLCEEGHSLASSSADRSRFLWPVAQIAVLRGEDASGLLEELERHAAETSDPDQRVAPLALHGQLLARDGDLAGACELFRQWLGQGIQSATDARIALMRAALWMRDRDEARAAADEIERDPTSGTYIDMLRTWARAGLAVLEDRRAEGVHGFRDAVTGLSSRGWTLDAMLMRLDALILLPDEPAFAPWADEARAFFTEQRASTLLERLDRAAKARVG
jgi:tetratricopeptide (TPR) repeat protein